VAVPTGPFLSGGVKRWRVVPGVLGRDRARSGAIGGCAKRFEYRIGAVADPASRAVPRRSGARV